MKCLSPLSRTSYLWCHSSGNGCKGVLLHWMSTTSFGAPARKYASPLQLPCRMLESLQVLNQVIWVLSLGCDPFSFSCLIQSCLLCHSTRFIGKCYEYSRQLLKKHAWKDASLWYPASHFCFHKASCWHIAWKVLQVKLSTTICFVGRLCTMLSTSCGGSTANKPVIPDTPSAMTCGRQSSWFTACLLCEAHQSNCNSSSHNAKNSCSDQSSSLISLSPCAELLTQSSSEVFNIGNDTYPNR